MGKVSHQVNPGDRNNRSMVLGSPGRSLLSAPDDTSLKGPDAEEMGVSKNSGFSPKSSILIGFSIINHPFWRTPIFGNIQMEFGRFYEGFGEGVGILPRAQ